MNPLAIAELYPDYLEQDFPVERFVRGDANSDGSINLTDGIVILNYLYLGAAPPACLDAADVDDDGGNLPTITDAIYIFNWLFLGGVEPGRLVSHHIWLAGKKRGRGIERRGPGDRRFGVKTIPGGGFDSGDHFSSLAGRLVPFNGGKYFSESS